jgi:hypothetical protein
LRYFAFGAGLHADTASTHHVARRRVVGELIKVPKRIAEKMGAHDYPHPPL